MKTDRPLPLRWTAPEVVTKLSYSVRSDVYAFGVFVFEVYSFGAFPFQHIKNDQTFLGLLGGKGGGEEVATSLAGELPLSKLNDAPSVVHVLLEGCLLRESKERPSFEEIVDRTKPVATPALMAVPTDDVAGGGVVGGVGAETIGSESESTKEYVKGDGEGERIEPPVRLDALTNSDPGYLTVGNASNKGGASATNDESAVEPKKTGPKRKPSVNLGFNEGGGDEGATETSEL